MVSFKDTCNKLVEKEQLTQGDDTLGFSTVIKDLVPQEWKMMLESDKGRFIPFKMRIEDDSLIMEEA